MAKKKQIPIKVSDSIPRMSIQDMNDFQGDLKHLSATAKKKLKNSIMKKGFRIPIFIWQNNILDGHQRMEAIQSLIDDGHELENNELPYVEIYADDEKDAKEMLLAISSRYGEMTVEGFTEFVEFGDLNLPDLDEIISFPELDLSGMINIPAETTGDDNVPKAEAIKKITELGDIWELNNHRLMCGDATDKDSVERLMKGEKADMVFTDPPYGVDYDGGMQFKDGDVVTGSREKLVNDDTSDIYNLSIPLMAENCTGPIYTWFADTKAKDIYTAVGSLGETHALIIWVKNGGYGALNANYKQKHEPCLYWKAKGSTLKWCGKSTECTIWEIDKDGVNRFHPTQKPVALAERAIKNHTAEKVLDLFLGSGTTLIACEKTGRKCYGMEIDPHYCDVIVKRYTNFCNENGIKLRIKRNGKKYEE